MGHHAATNDNRNGHSRRTPPAGLPLHIRRSKDMATKEVGISDAIKKLKSGEGDKHGKDG